MRPLALAVSLGALALAWASPGLGASPVSATLGALAPPAGRLALSPPARLGASSQPPVRYRPVGCVAKGGAVVHTHGPMRKVVALSFDDGPAPITAQFVRMLHAQRAVATFFLVGDQLSRRYGGLLHEELRDGDALGDHSWSHPVLTSANVHGQLGPTQLAIAELSGYTPCLLRPPYGAYSAGVLQAARSLKLATVTWNVDPRDWALPGTGAIVARVLAETRPGSIVLSHDGGGPRGQTLAAYPAIVKALRARGYRFRTIPQLLGFHTVYRRCRLHCEGAAVSGPLPPGSIVEGSARARLAARPVARPAIRPATPARPAGGADAGLRG